MAGVTYIFNCQTNTASLTLWAPYTIKNQLLLSLKTSYKICKV